MGRFVLLFLFVTNSLSAQTKLAANQSALKQSVTTQVSQMALLFKLEDYKGYLNYIHRAIIEATGGEAQMIKILNNNNLQLKNRNVSINDISFNPPSGIVMNKGELQCTISQQTELRPARGKIITYSTLIAISTDSGKNWKFIDTSNMDLLTLRRLLPNLSNNITLPARQKPKVSPI